MTLATAEYPGRGSKRPGETASRRHRLGVGSLSTLGARIRELP